MVSVYAYLLAVNEKPNIYPPDRSVWDRLCCWVLFNIYGARFWRETAMATSKALIARHKEEMAALGKRRDTMQRLLIQEKYYNTLAYSINLEGPKEKIEFVGNAYAHLSDAEFSSVVAP